MGKFTNLQVGRIVAASLVLVFHASFYGRYVLGVPHALDGPVPAYAFRTTVVFLFALSGFVLAHCLQRESIRAFVAHRLLRLFPAYWAALTIVFAIQCAASGQPFSLKSIWYAYALWPAGPGRSASILHVEWTLVYELYLSLSLAPLAMLGRRRGLGVGVSLWLALCLGRQLVAPGRDIPWSPRLAELPLSIVNVPFLLGVLVYLTRESWAGVRKLALPSATLALLGGATCVLSAANGSYLLQSVGAAALVAWCATARQVSPGNRLVTAGDWSYGVYLIHAPVVMACFTLYAWTGWTPSAFVVVLGGVIALAAGAWFGALECAGSRRLRAMRKPEPRSFPEVRVASKAA